MWFSFYANFEDALSLFLSTNKEGIIVPNNVTFVGVLFVCCYASLIDVACEVFCTMKVAYGIRLNIERYECMVDFLGRGGKFLEAQECIKVMPRKPDVVILGALQKLARMMEMPRLTKEW